MEQQQQKPEKTREISKFLFPYLQLEINLLHFSARMDAAERKLQSQHKRNLSIDSNRNSGSNLPAMEHILINNR